MFLPRVTFENFVGFGTVFAVSMFLLLAANVAAEMEGPTLLNLLAEKDRICRSSDYVISFSIMKNTSILYPGQGSVFKDGVATRKGDILAIKISYIYEHEPVFVSPRTGQYRTMEYNRDGSLIVWRPIETYAVSGPEHNDTIWKNRHFSAQPDGKVDSGNQHLTVFHYPIGSRDSIYEYCQYELAAGRGYAKYIDSVKDIQKLPAGVLKAVCEGSYGSNVKGSWQLTVDPNSDYLVREAVFTQYDMNTPVLVATSNGIETKDQITMAQSGTLKFSDVLDIIVQTNSISKAATPNGVFDEVVAEFNAALPTGSHIMDRRGDKPVTTVVK